MKELMNKVLNVDKKILLFLIIISIAGIITGSVFMTILDPNDRILINDTLESFMSQYGQINTKIYLINNSIINFLYILLIWILGISIIGLPIVILIVFIKSFLISFTISSFIIKYKYKGILLGIIYNIPHNIINLIIYIYLGVYSVKFSLSIINTIINKKSFNLKRMFNKYLVVLVISFIFIIITTLYETYLMPLFLKKIIKVIKL